MIYEDESNLILLEYLLVSKIQLVYWLPLFLVSYAYPTTYSTSCFLSIYLSINFKLLFAFILHEICSIFLFVDAKLLDMYTASI